MRCQSSTMHVHIAGMKCFILLIDDCALSRLTSTTCNDDHVRTRLALAYTILLSFRWRVSTSELKSNWCEWCPCAALTAGIRSNGSREKLWWIAHVPHNWDASNLLPNNKWYKFSQKPNPRVWVQFGYTTNTEIHTWPATCLCTLCVTIRGTTCVLYVCVGECVPLRWFCLQWQ